MLTSRERMRREVKAAFPEVRDRFHFTRLQLSRMARAPISPSLMARRMKLALQEDFAGDARQVRVPTLVITGERGLDRVVPIESTHEYLSLIPHATATVIEPHWAAIARSDGSEPAMTSACEKTAVPTTKNAIGAAIPLLRA